MATQGPLSPGTAVDDASIGTIVWTTPTGAQVGGDVLYAQAQLDNTNTTSHLLKATNFGFSIPSVVTINGILVEIAQWCTDSVSENSIQIVKADGTIGATNKSTGATFPTSNTYIPYGSSSDLWGETWDATKINDVRFGVVFSAIHNATANSRTTRVDHIRITVYYTLASSLTGISQLTGVSSLTL